MCGPARPARRRRSEKAGRRAASHFLHREPDELYEVAPLRRFAGLSLTRGRGPDKTTIPNFRRLPETHDLAPRMLAAVSAHPTRLGLLLRVGTMVDATIIHAPPSTKNRAHARVAEMHQSSP